MSIQTKIRSAILLVVFIMAAATGVILWNQGQLHIAFTVLNSSYQLEDHLLECRRQEKNFLLRGGTEYIRQFQVNYDSLTSLSSRLVEQTDNRSIKTALVKLSEFIDNYGTAFNQISGFQNMNEVTSREDGTIDEMVEIARACHASIAGIRAMSIEQFNHTRASTHLVNLSAVFIGILLSVFVAGMITDRLLKSNEDTGA